MALQPVLIIGLVFAALLYSIAAFIYRRKGLRTKNWYVLIGAYIVVLLGFALVGYFGWSQAPLASTATIVASLNIVFALQWRPPTGESNK